MDSRTPKWKTVSTSFCWICAHSVDLKNCKKDEYGNAVHDACNAARMRINAEALKQFQIHLRSAS